MFLSSRALESPAEHLGTVGICQKRCQKNNPQNKLLNNRKRNRQESHKKIQKKIRTNTNIVKNIVENIVQQHLTLVFFKLVQYQLRLNRKIQLFVDEGVRFENYWSQPIFGSFRRA